jgi:hypothetical protein
MFTSTIQRPETIAKEVVTLDKQMNNVLLNGLENERYQA